MTLIDDCVSAIKNRKSKIGITLDFIYLFSYIFFHHVKELNFFIFNFRLIIFDCLVFAFKSQKSNIKFEGAKILLFFNMQTFFYFF